MKKILLFIVLSTIISCSKEKDQNLEKELPEQIVLIAKNTPEKFTHIVKADSIGKKIKDSTGVKMFFENSGFSYVNSQNIIANWKPTNKEIDTLVVPYYNNYLEVSFFNPYSAIKESFLIKNGDTVVFDFNHNIPYATVINRKVNDLELNYNRYRMLKVFDNKYSSHHLIFASLFIDNDFKNFKKNSYKHYLQSVKDSKKEKKLLDSLRDYNIIPKINYNYRIEIFNNLNYNNKQTKYVKDRLKEESSLKSNELIEGDYSFDLSKTDSLMKFYFFRNYLSSISRYDLKFISEDHGTPGSKYIDSRIRFDSILQDKRFNQTTRNLLLFQAYIGIGRNFRVKDKEVYFKKLQQETTNKERLKKLAKEHQLDFSQSDKLLMTSLQGESTTYKDVINKHKGTWLYVDIWASWCRPCRKAMPASKRLQKEFSDKNVAFIYIGLNDQKENWKKAIVKDAIQEGQHYFVENGNTSKVVEDLNINTIPHYLIYNPKGELVHGFADRPGQGARKQLMKFLNTEK